MAITVLCADAILAENGVIVPGELAFDSASGEILYVGEGPAPQREEAAVLRELPGRILMPGLVNGHTHSAMTLLRGVSDDAGFMPWLAAVQGLEQHLTHEDVRVGVQLAMLEMIETGTTLFADMYHWDTELVQEVLAAGMRAHLAVASFAPGVVGFPGVSDWDGTAATAAAVELHNRYADSKQVRIAFGPHTPYTCPPEFLRQVREQALASGIPIHTHISESPAEITQITAQYGRTPGAHLSSLGLFDAEVLAAHCVHLTAEEIADFAAHGVAVSHNPVSNLKLGNGIADLCAWQEAGLRITIGTDSVASNNTLDLFEEIKLATMLQRGAAKDAGAFLARDTLHHATRGGAKALGFAHTGALAVGLQADVIALAVTGNSATPLNLAAEPAQLISHLGFAATGADVREVWVAGRHLYSEGEHLTLDAPAIRRAAQAARERLREAATKAGAA